MQRIWLTVDGQSVAKRPGLPGLPGWDGDDGRRRIWVRVEFSENVTGDFFGDALELADLAFALAVDPTRRRGLSHFTDVLLAALEQVLVAVGAAAGDGGVADSAVHGRRLLFELELGV